MISAFLDAWLRPSRTSQPRTRTMMKYSRRKDMDRDHASTPYGHQPEQLNSHVAGSEAVQGNLTAQDEDLVPKYLDLRVLRSIAPGEEDQPAEQPDHEQIDKSDEHD